MYDAIIIGGGPAGVAAATRIAQLGKKAAIIERDLLGGVCTNWGCIPTKAMIAGASLFHSLHHAQDLGINVVAKVNFSKVIKHRDEQVQLSRDHAKKILDSYGVEIKTGIGRIVDKKHVACGNEVFETKNIIICTGSESKMIPGIPTSEHVLTSKELVTIRTLPTKLVIIGGGVIGVEFASIFSSLGSKVTIVESCDRLIMGEDPEISSAIRTELEKNGVEVLLGASLKSITPREVITSVKNLPYTKVLIAIGRYPVLDTETLQRLSIKFGKQGIEVNDRMQSSIGNIYAIGDSTGKSILAHVGTRQALVAANTICGVKDKMEYVVPRCVYSIPEIACVGKTEREAKNPRIGIYPLSYNPRALLEKTSGGFVKVILEKDAIVGFQMIGHNVTEIINEATIIIARKMRARDVIETIHPHPTIGESIRFAVQMALGECVDVPRQNILAPGK